MGPDYKRLLKYGKTRRSEVLIQIGVQVQAIQMVVVLDYAEEIAGGGTMTKQIQSILDEAVKLPATEKLVLVEGILTSLSLPDEDWNRAWSREGASRMAEYKAGKVEAIDADEVFAELDASLQ